MRRILLSAIVALVAALFAVGFAGAQAAPQFQRGFAAMAQMIPDVVGAPLENEHADSSTGDSVQRTTTGVLVWRKADNVTAFTDGSTTWLIGPQGLQSRPNASRFNWERTISPADLPQEAVSLSFSRTGPLWKGEGTIRNTLTVPVDVEIDAVGYDASGAHPILDAPTIYLFNLAPGATRPLNLMVHADSDVGRWAVSVNSHPVASRSSFSVDVGTTEPLEIDPQLSGAVTVLRKTEAGLWLLRVSAEHGVVVAYDQTEPGTLGTFDPDTGEVVVSTNLDSTSSWVRAVVLAHELSHAHNVAAGNQVSTPLQCYREEAQAFQRQASIWDTLWGGELPSDLISPYHEEMNDITRTVLNDPETFVEQLVRRYRSECGPLAQSPSSILPGP